ETVVVARQRTRRVRDHLPVGMGIVSPAHAHPPSRLFVVDAVLTPWPPVGFSAFWPRALASVSRSAAALSMIVGEASVSGFGGGGGGAGALGNMKLMWPLAIELLQFSERLEYARPPLLRRARGNSPRNRLGEGEHEAVPPVRRAADLGLHHVLGLQQHLVALEGVGGLGEVGHQLGAV